MKAAVRKRWTLVLYMLIGLAAVIAAAIAYGMNRWRSETEERRARLESTRVHDEPGRFHMSELEGLPAPVQRYFRAALTDNQRMIAAVSIQHAGTFNMSETGEDWKPFTSNQRVITRRPGFDWEARIAMAPGLDALVHDSYIGGEGILHASVFGLFSIVNMRGTPEVAQGELMRFLAETAWYPTALLPGRGVRWEAVDDSSAHVTIEDGGLSLTMLFRFGADGLIAFARAENRMRTVGDSAVPTEWEGRWSSYERRDGMMVPMAGEVAWIVPEGRKPYWRGSVTSIRHEFAG
jgi:hypothetical protein